jgi:adenylylsulfate reductase subunit B
MSIAINKNKCVGCGQCKKVCPGSLIKLDAEKKAYIKYLKDCWGCTSCIKECKANAIGFFLGADIGGMGSLVHTEKEGDILKWIIEAPDGEISEIDINQKESNKY